MNWYKESQLDFGAELAHIGNLGSELMSNEYIQHNNNPNNDLTLDELNQQLDVNNSKSDPEIQAMEQDLVNAEDQDGDGVNDVDQIMKELGVEANNNKAFVKTAQVANEPWLNAQMWQRIGQTAQEQYNTNLAAFKANVARYRTVKSDLAAQKAAYDKGEMTDKGSLRVLVDEAIKWVTSSKQYGLTTLKMQKVIERVRDTIMLLANEDEQVIQQNSPILNRSYAIILELMSS